MMPVDLDTSIFDDIFTAEGAIELRWEQASRCSCYSEDSDQPEWGHEPCHGTGVLYGAPQIVRGLFRSQSRWLSFRREGELAHGEVTLTTPLAVKPGYTDRRVRDRFTTIPAEGDAAEGRVFLPAAQASPFIFSSEQRAWRVDLQAADETDRLVENP